MKVFRPIVGLVTAIVLTPLGFGLIWFGNGEATANRLAGVLLSIVGIALLLMVVQTGHVSSFGLILAGVVVTAFGLVAFLSSDVAHSATEFFAGISGQVRSGSEKWIALAFVLAIGIVFLGAAVATWFAHRPTDRSTSPAIRTVISILLALTGSVVGFGFITRSDQNVVLLGALVLGATVVTGMISSGGLFVSGFIVFVVGILSFFFDSLAHAIAQTPLLSGNDMAVGAQSALQLGFVATVGAIFLATAIVTRSAHARASRRVS